MSDWPGPAAAVVEQMLTGKQVHLVPPTPRHLAFLVDLASRRELSARWLGTEFAGEPTRLARALQTSRATFVVEARSTAAPMGLVGAYDVDLQHGHAKVGVLGDTHPQAEALVLQGALLLTEYIFATWHLRKVYFEVPDGTAILPMEMVLRLAQVEGRLRAHHYHQSRFVDLVILAIHRSNWDALAMPVLDAIQDLDS